MSSDTLDIFERRTDVRSTAHSDEAADFHFILVSCLGHITPALRTTGGEKEERKEGEGEPEPVCDGGMMISGHGNNGFRF